MSKYAMMLVSGLMLASCANYEIGDIQESEKAPTVSQKSFSVDFDENNKSLQKAWLSTGIYNEGSDRFFDMEFRRGDELTVFANSNNNTFKNFNVGSKADFVGEAEDADGYYALFPAIKDASIQGNVIHTTVSTYDSIGSWNFDYKYPEGGLCTGFTKNESVALCHVTGYLVLEPFYFEETTSEWGSKYITRYYQDFFNPTDGNCLFNNFDKVVIEASDYIAGDVSIEVGEDGMPKVGKGTSKTITIKSPFAKGVYVGMLPVEDVDLKISLYRMDGEVFVSNYKHFSLNRAQIKIINKYPQEESYKVTFKDGDITKEAIVEKGNYINVFPDWTREGYNLKWLDEQGNEYVDTVTLYRKGLHKGIVADRTFTAKWEKIEEGCFVTYPTNDGDKRVQVTPGDYFTLPELPDGAIYWENPKYPDHGHSEFSDDGFSYKYGCKYDELRLQPGDKIQILESTTLSFNYYNSLITIDANGGKFADGSSLMEWRFPDGQYVCFETNYGSNNMAMTNIYWYWERKQPDEVRALPTREGYQLIGFKMFYDGTWYNSTRCSDASVYGNPIFVAQWVEAYKIEYLDESGNVASTGQYIDGEFFNLDFTLSDTGKQQTGWKDQDGNVWRIGKNYISVLGEVKPLTLTPVFSN